MTVRTLRALGFAFLLLGVLGSSVRATDGKDATRPAFSPPKLRAAAEWEPTLGLIVAWPLAVPKDLVIEIVKDDHLYLMVSDDHRRGEARSSLEKWGVDLERVHFIVAPQSGPFYCTSDWGPLAVFDGKSVRLADPKFGGYPWAEPGSEPSFYPPGSMGGAQSFENMDRAPRAVAQALGVEHQQLDFWLCPGNLLVDGNDRAFTTEIMIGESEHFGVSKEQLFEKCKKELGFDQLFVLPNYETSGVQHVTCLMKLLDEERVLVTRVPGDHMGHAMVEAFVAKLATFENTFGRPYEILRLDAPAMGPDSGGQAWGNPANYIAWYADAIILNEKVFIPQYGRPEDETALRQWRAAMPGYAVTGFENPTEPKNLYANTLHCRTIHVWDTEMIYMRHKRLESVVAAPEYPVEVLIRDYSDAGLDPDRLFLSWRLRGDEEWRRVPLVRGGQPEMYTAAIPGPHGGRTLEYFVAAADLAGKEGTLPRTAPAAFHSFAVTEATSRL